MMKMKQETMILLAFIIGLMFMSDVSSWAQSSTPREETWVTDGPVYAIVRTADTVYIGGDFTYVGPSTGCGVPIDAATGQPVAVFPKVNGFVYASAPDRLGGWYIGGDFTRVGSFDRNRIAHILPDGSVDPAWNPIANDTVSALKVSGDGSTVYAGGLFTSIGGQWRYRIAALDATTGAATAWNPIANDWVRSLAVKGSTVYAGGDFTSIGGQTRNYIAALNAATGSATAWNPDAGGAFPYVYALAVTSSTVYAGGSFTLIGGQTRNCIAALDASTGDATAWNPIANDCVRSLALSGSTVVYAGGEFTWIGGQTRNYIAALNRATGNATAWNPNADYYVDALAVSGDGNTVYAGGEFSRIGGVGGPYLAALDAVTGKNAAAWNPNANGHVDAPAVSGSTVYAGGEFTSIGGQRCYNIAALDAVTGNPTGWHPGADMQVSALAVSGDGSTVYAGGYFTSIGGQTRMCIAALDSITGNATAWNPNANSYVNALAVSGGGSTVYAGGHFTSIGGKSRYFMAALDATTGYATSWYPNPNDLVYGLAVSGSTVYAWGEFTWIGWQARNYIAALDATTGNATAWNPNSDWYVDALAFSGDGSTVYAGGLFTSIGGQWRCRIAALDATTGNATAWNPCANTEVSTVAVSGSTVYAGGWFTSIGGQARNRIAALDAVTGNATAWNPDADWMVQALAVSGDGSTIYAGGWFTTIGADSLRSYFAQFDSTSTPTPTETPAPTSSPTETPIPTPTETSLPSYDFSTDAQGWTYHTVPAVFSEPASAVIPGFLQIISTDNANNFGYWQSPQNAAPIAPGYLYRARFRLLSDQTNQALVPQIRLRANSSNLQQSDYIGIESSGDGGASPAPAGNTYDLYFVPPANDTYCMLAFDLLNFNPADAAQAELSLDSVLVERFPVDSLSTPTLLRSHEFTASEDAWTTGGGQVVFSNPEFIHEAGTLQLRSMTNTNTFGYWSSNAADITLAGDLLYRGRFEVRTDVTSRSLVPQMRLRFNTGNLQASRTLGIESTGDGGSSPGTANTIYDNLYFLPPANCVGAGLIISFDMLNFDPSDSPTGSLILDRAVIETLPIPSVP